MASRLPRGFAPLRQSASLGSTASPVAAPRLRGIVFDMDGTLCEPQTYMFGQMRAALKIDKSVDILEHVETLAPEEQAKALHDIREIERQAMAKQVPQPGLSSLMSYLDSRHIPKAICTRNFDAPVQNLLSKFLSETQFEPIITRDFKPPKPHPAGIFKIASDWGLENPLGEPDASSLIMVGDSVDDMTAGRRAGATTVLLANDVNRHLADHEDTDLVIERLDDLATILEDGLSARAR